LNKILLFFGKDYIYGEDISFELAHFNSSNIGVEKNTTNLTYFPNNINVKFVDKKEMSYVNDIGNSAKFKFNLSYDNKLILNKLNFNKI
jgi:hypothetical protein